MRIQKEKCWRDRFICATTPNDAAYVAGAMSSIGMSVRDIENQAEYIKAVSYRQVAEAADALFSSAPSLTGILKPKEKK